MWFSSFRPILLYIKTSQQSEIIFHISFHLNKWFSRCMKINCDTYICTFIRFFVIQLQMPSYNIHQSFLYFFLNICGAFYGYTQQSTTEWQFNQMPQNPKLRAGYITSVICYNLLLNCYKDICQNHFKSYFPLLKILMKFG